MENKEGEGEEKKLPNLINKRRFTPQAACGYLHHQQPHRCNPGAQVPVGKVRSDPTRPEWGAQPVAKCVPLRGGFE